MKKGKLIMTAQKNEYKILKNKSLYILKICINNKKSFINYKNKYKSVYKLLGIIT